MNTSLVNEVRGVLIQVAGHPLLLPNAATVEVLSFGEPERIEHAPDWLLGRIRWRGWRLPLVAFSSLAGGAPDSPGVGSKVVVLKALGGDAAVSYFALVAQGFPRLVTVSRDNMIADTEYGETLPEVVRARVVFNYDVALVPDLDATERRIAEALEQSAQRAAELHAAQLHAAELQAAELQAAEPQARGHATGEWV